MKYYVAVGITNGEVTVFVPCDEGTFHTWSRNYVEPWQNPHQLTEYFYYIEVTV